MKKWIIPWVLCFILLCNACSSNARLANKAQKNYDKGNYEIATQEAMRALSKKTDNPKTQELLVQSWQNYRLAQQRKIEKLIQSNDTNKWEQIYLEYTSLQNLAEQIQSLPPLINPYTGYKVVIDIPDYAAEIKQSQENAAEAHYQTGILYAKMNNAKDTQKKAALEFKEALKLIPNYQDAALRYEQSRKLALKRIAITPFEDKSNTSGIYGAVSDILTDQIVSLLLSSANTEFVEIIDRTQLEAVMKEQQLTASGLINNEGSFRLGQILGADEILTGRILQINATPERTVSITSEDETEVIIRTEEYTDEDGNTQEREIKGKVFCRYRKFTKTANVSISTSYCLLEVETGKIKQQETVEIKNAWSDTWARKISGDERALSNNIKKQMEKAEPFPPSLNEMVKEALKQTGNDIANKLCGYLS